MSTQLRQRRQVRLTGVRRIIGTASRRVRIMGSDARGVWWAQLRADNWEHVDHCDVCGRPIPLHARFGNRTLIWVSRRGEVAHARCVTLR